MNDNEYLEQLLAAAHKDPALRQRLLETRKTSDPMASFCDLANSLGYPISIGGLLTLGEEYNGNQMKSTNGGGVNPYFLYDDPYETFFITLEYME